MNGKARRIIAIRSSMAGLLLLSSAAHAATYHVSPTGGPGAGTIDDPWSLQHAKTNAVAGDIVFLRGGTYTGDPKSHSSICPANSGTEESMITFSAYNDESVILRDCPGFPSGVYLKDRSYIKIHGITVKRSERMLTILNGSHNEIGHCTFDEYLPIPDNRPLKARIAQNSRYNWIHDCTFSRSGAIGPGPVYDDLGATMTIGLSNSGVGGRAEDDSSHNLIENNTFYHGGHHLLQLNTSYNVVRNNYFHNEG